MPRRLVAPCCLCAVAALLVAELALGAPGAVQTRAAFPGANGKIAFERDDAIYVMNADGSGVSPAPLAGGGWAPRSPDGAKVAFTSWADWPYRDDIYVVNADSSGRTRLTKNGAIDTDPAWSPDGST